VCVCVCVDTCPNVITAERIFEKFDTEEFHTSQLWREPDSDGHFTSRPTCVSVRASRVKPNRNSPNIYLREKRCMLLYFILFAIHSAMTETVDRPSESRMIMNSEL
jgi:hypothetical protein